MQQTLSELSAEDRARRERARRYEELQNATLKHRATISRLESNVINTDALQRIGELTSEVPNDLTTRGKRFAFGGFNVRETIAAIAADALIVAERRARERVEELSQARLALERVEAELKEFE